MGIAISTATSEHRRHPSSAVSQASLGKLNLCLELNHLYKKGHEHKACLRFAVFFWSLHVEISPISPAALTLKQSRNLTRLGINVNVVEARPGRQSWHRRHVADERVNEFGTSR